MAKGGFPGGYGGGNINNPMKQAQKMQKQMEEAQAKLAEVTVNSTAGGGAIKVTMTGDQKCKSVEISPEFLKDADAELLQDMVLSAVNLALDESRALQEKIEIFQHPPSVEGLAHAL